MISLAEQAKHFWGASYVMRRASERNTTQARIILDHLGRTASRQIQRRAIETLKEFSNDQRPPEAG